MREIKFRQWIPQSNRMDCNIGMTGDGEWTGFSKVTWSRYPVMQYTGLKDKTGKEIYEGDIVIIKWFEGEDYELFVCQWDDEMASFEFKDLEECPTYLGGGSYDKIEIIGNIYEDKNLLYENPELINGNNKNQT